MARLANNQSIVLDAGNYPAGSQQRLTLIDIDIERDSIMKGLEQTRFNKTKTAVLLGMSFRLLRYRIK